METNLDTEGWFPHTTGNFNTTNGCYFAIVQQDELLIRIKHRQDFLETWARKGTFYDRVPSLTTLIRLMKTNWKDGDQLEHGRVVSIIRYHQ